MPSAVCEKQTQCRAPEIDKTRPGTDLTAAVPTGNVLVSAAGLIFGVLDPGASVGLTRHDHPFCAMAAWASSTACGEET